MPNSSEPDYRALFRKLPDAFLLIGADPAATIIDNTDAHEAIAGKPREAVVGRPFFDAWPPNSQGEADVIRASHEHVRTQREAHRMPLIRYDLQQADGQYEEAYWEATHYPVLDEAGNLSYIVQRTQNVTERIRAERERALAASTLAEQRALNAFVLDVLPLIVWTSKPSGEVGYLNQGWFDYTGMAPDTELPADTSSYIHPDDLPAVTAAWTRSLETNSFGQFEYRLRRHDGVYRWFLGRVAPHLDEQQRLNQWAGCATDIHDQRMLVQEMEVAAEEQAALVELAYQASREANHQRDTFYSLFQQAPAMICVLRGPEHRYEFVNPVYQSIFPDRTLVGRTVKEALPEVEEQGIIDLLDSVYQTGTPFYGNELALSFANSAGGYDERYFNFIYQQARESDGKVSGIMVFAFEVTELVRARQRLERLANPGAPAQP